MTRSDRRVGETSKGRRYAVILALFAMLALLAIWGQPVPTLSAGPEARDSASLSSVDPSAAVIYTVDRCPPNFEQPVYAPGQIVYLHGTGFQPYEPIYWDIHGMPGSCDADKRVAHSRMTAGWNGSFCIYCYTVPVDDCGTYKVTVNNLYHTYYDVPFATGPTPTPTPTHTNTPTITPTVLPTPYAFSGYVYEELLVSAGASMAADQVPLADVRVELYFGRGENWTLVDSTRTTTSGWFALDYVTGVEQPRFRIVEIDPSGYASLRAEKPPLFGWVIDDNTIEMRPPYGHGTGVMYFYDYKADPTQTPSMTPTLIGTPPTPTMTPTPIPQDKIITRVLQQGADGYMGVEDTYISSWYLYQNYHRDNRMSIRSGDMMAPMLRFDLSFIPPNSRVLDAKLSLYAVTAGPHPMQARAFRTFRPWVVSEVNWIEASKGYKWGEWGCNEREIDRADGYEAEQTLTGVGRWYDFELIDMAQAWIESTGQNQGVILKGFGDIAVQWNFYTSEYWQAEHRPKLTITYALGPATPTPTPTRRATATPSATPTATPTWFIPFGEKR